jgi:hypothetical protein
MTDLYRSGSYQGPEPWLSILKGVRMAVQTIKDRSVAGDRACLILYNDVLDWRHVINLTDNFDYILTLLNEEEITGVSLSDAKLSNWKDHKEWPPKWIQLGMFPTPGRNTFTSLAFKEAIDQFADDKFKVPSVDFVVHFGDGLPNCYINAAGQITCNAQQYEAYRQAMLQISNLVYNGFFKSKIALHMFMTGDSVGPHTRLELGPGQTPINPYDADWGGNPPTESNCLTDEQARHADPPVDYVIGQGLDLKDGGNPQAQTIFQHAFDNPPQPFYQANLDWYRLVRMTGGRWAPLRKNPVDCTPHYDCTSNNGNQRLLQDPLCRSTEDQVKDHLSEVLTESAGFVVVK